MLEAKVIGFLENLRERQPMPLQITLWTGAQLALAERPTVSLTLRSASAARHLLNPSLHSLGEAFVEGDIDLDGPIRDVLCIAESLAREQDGHARRGRLPSMVARHTRRTDRSAIEYHYDVSNAFYAAWLDPQMVYSCAYYRAPSDDLATAQAAKLDHVCRKLMLKPGQRLLDIGCGWGALAIHAATRYGARVVGITLSRNQFELATERVREAGVSDAVEIRMQDYRDIARHERFDRISSIGMFEHVGLKRLREYFDTIHTLLEPGGITLNHGITSSDVDSREVGLGAGEFIDRYVFPDGELPHVSLAIREMSAAGLELVDAESLRRHYARTLWAWSDAFERRFAQLSALAGERRARIWRVYLAGCAHAFEHDWINLYQLLAVRSQRTPNGALSPVPMTRDYMYR